MLRFQTISDGGSKADNRLRFKPRLVDSFDRTDGEIGHDGREVVNTSMEVGRPFLANLRS